ncbi:MAG: two-component regulator propeller domain-containing protein [Bryobacteraceae bacterium]
MPHLLLLLAGLAWGEQLPMVVLSARDGLPAGTVPRILADSRGYVWFPHSEGLTRYDGNSFHTFTKADGLPSDRIYDIIERKDGAYWIAAKEHLCLFDPGGGKQRFRCEAPGLGEIHAILQEDGAMWCGTERGLWRRKGGGGWEGVAGVKAEPAGRSVEVRRLLKDSRGAIWAATFSGLYRFHGDTFDRWSRSEGFQDDYFVTVSETPGAIWAATQTELLRFAIDAGSSEARITVRYGRADGLPSEYATDIHFWQGSVWAATFQGLARLLPSGRWQEVEVDHAIRSLPLESLATDSRGGLWLGTDGGGAARLPGSGFSRFTESDGLPIPKVWAIQEDRKGELTVITKDQDQYALNRFDGLRFHPVRPASPHGTLFGWSWSQIAVHSRSGEWWLATAHGLLRYPDGLQSQPSLAEGLRAGSISRVFEERGGAIWASIYEVSNNGLFRRDPATGRFRSFTEDDGLPSLKDASTAASCFVEDRHGQVWIGLLNGGLLRYRNGRFDQFSGRVVGAPEHGVRALLMDHRGRLWVGTTSQGVLRVDDLQAETPGFTAYDRSVGLSSDFVSALAEDLQGRIYAAGAGSVDSLDPQQQPLQVRRLTTADGMISGKLRVAFRDRHGALWFGGDQGLCRIIPREEPAQETSILIHSIHVNGARQPISELGEAEPASLSLESSQRQLTVEFGGFGHDLRYQTLLSGVDSGWSALSTDRNVHLTLTPGVYELLIRGESTNGSIRVRPARMRFSVAAPVWQRWWFVVLTAAALIGAGYWIHLLVLERKLAIERTRSVIATDLHDDIGSSLARISVLSDVLRAQLGRTSEQSPVIDQIAISARDVIEKMNDIVWAIDPREDKLSDVVARIRRFASDVLDAKEIQWSFQAPPVSDELSLTLAQRRHLLLIFKEAIHNIVRHSKCRSAELCIELDRRALQARIKDDGAGIPDGSPRGRGLNSMFHRAEQLGGRLEVISTPGGGTEVSLRIPVGGAA